MTTEPDLDLICLGRAAVDLYGEQIDSPLEDIQSFDKSVGGCAANIAVGTARQGLRVAMLARVGDEHMGRFVRESLRREGVEVSHVKTDPERLTGLVLLSVADRNTFPLIFYRENCADMALVPEDFDAEFIGRAKALLVTGTHLSTPTTRAASNKAIECARRAGTKVVLDVDYRPVLWNLTGHGLGEQRYVESARVTEELQPNLPACDLVVGTEEEILIAGGETELLPALRAVRAATDAMIVVKRGPLGCVVFEGEIPENVEKGRVFPGNPVEVLNVLGAGDAFMSGFLRGYIAGEPLEQAAEYANGMGALVVSRNTCSTAMPSKAELDAYLRRAAGIPDIRADPELSLLHRLTYRRPMPDELCILAFDHRKQLEGLGPPEALADLKDAIAEAAERVASPGTGVIVDGRYGARALARMTGRGFVVGRPVEVPQIRPLAFVGDPNVELEILSWPQTQVVKCLAHSHPADPAELWARELASLLRLQSACRRLHREWLLELIPLADGTVDREALPVVMDRLVDAGVVPDWWKLPDPIDWAPVEKIVLRDPHARGVLLLGLAASEEEVAAAFDRAPAVCRGFAVGRTIFLDPARRYLAGEIDRETLVNDVAGAFERLIGRWRRRGNPI